jgi:hypothetical protein
MRSPITLMRPFIALSILVLLSGVAIAQRSAVEGSSDSSGEFGPVMRAYLGYLSNEQDVVDDRASRREITGAYYLRNSRRIRALRQMAIRLVRQSGNDYVPELEAVTRDEFGILFEKPPKPATFRANEILANKFRFLGAVQSVEVFYVFARLDPYEQAEQIQRQSKAPATLSTASGAGGADGQRVGETNTRPRRVVPR